MVEPVAIMGEVRRLRSLIETASDHLLKVQQELDDGLQQWYEDSVDVVELSLLKRSEDEDGYRLPSEALRVKVARQQIRDSGEANAERLERYDRLHRDRKRGEQRIRDLKTVAELNRSLLSAEKEGLV